MRASAEEHRAWAVGEVALADFRAVVILNSNAKLNLGDLASAPAPARDVRGSRQGQTPEPQPTAAAAQLKAPIEADLNMGKITLKGGAINYADNFVRPHYSVDLTNVGGKIGGFGTRSTKPAEVEVH